MSGYQHQHGKFASQRRHAAFQHIATTIKNHSGDVEYQTGAVAAYGGDNDEFFHSVLKIKGNRRLQRLIPQACTVECTGPKGDCNLFR